MLFAFDRFQSLWFWFWLRLRNRFLCVNYGLSGLVNGWLQFALSYSFMQPIFIQSQLLNQFDSNQSLTFRKESQWLSEIGKKAFVIGWHPQHKHSCSRLYTLFVSRNRSHLNHLRHMNCVILRDKCCKNVIVVRFRFWYCKMFNHMLNAQGNSQHLCLQMTIFNKTFQFEQAFF